MHDKMVRLIEDRCRKNPIVFFFSCRNHVESYRSLVRVLLVFLEKIQRYIKYKLVPT
jgi:hypothetical protein